MSSYNDCNNAKKWKKLYDSGKNHKDGLIKIRNKLNYLLNKAFSHLNVNIEYSKYIKMHYWKFGVACWKKNVDSDYVSEKLLNVCPNFYICGENYSKYQAWCEGALMTCEQVLQKIDCKMKNEK